MKLSIFAAISNFYNISFGTKNVWYYKDEITGHFKNKKMIQKFFDF